MNSDNWSRVKQLFEEAFELSPEDRDAFLDTACQGDGSLRVEVDALLAAHEAEGDLLQSPTSAPTRAGVAMEGPGATIGRYKLLQQIGEGGFGSVYMAEQEQPVRRKVALKIIKLGMDTKQVIARFEAERQALALMDHPNIARVLDAGATEAGRPYFVMELVRGIPITEYCDQNSLTMKERLELFQPVCSAVGHAHQKGIIHRDIKPSNVMVTLHDGVPVPKVIDFGIAKATNQRLTEKTLFTEYHQFIGTPQYMSPEQAEMSGLDVDTRTDIYALGVLLYELLTGTTPFDAEKLRHVAYTEIHRVIRDEEPEKPSTRLSSLGDAATETAKRRATNIATLRKSLSGDLDWIVMRAIEKDRTRRYETANALRLDVVRYLASEPVLASPPSATYRAQKFFRRNRVAVVVSAVVAVALLAGSTLATLGFLEARAEAQSARAINDFLNGMLASVDPQQTRSLSVFSPEGHAVTTNRGAFDRNVSVIEMLRQAGEGVEEAFDGKPLLEAEVRETLGVTLRGLGHEGESHLEKALEIRRQVLPENHPDRLRSEFQVALESGKAERVQAARDALEAVYGPDHPRTLSATSHLAYVLTVDRDTSNAPRQGPSRFSQARELYQKTLQKQRQILGDEHRDVLDTMVGLADWNLWSGRGAQAEELTREVYGIAQRVLGPDDVLTLWAGNLVGWSLNFQGRHEEAEQLLRDVMAKQERVLAPDHPHNVSTLMGLGRALHRPEDLDEKEEVWRRGVESAKGDTNGWVFRRDLAFFLVRRGKTDEGIRMQRELHEDCLKTWGEQNSWTTLAEKHLSEMLRAADRHREANDLAKASIERLHRQAQEPDATAGDLNDYAWSLLTVWPPELRNPRAALQAAEAAVARESNASIQDTMARARQMTGDLPGAIEAQRESVQQGRLEDIGDEDLIVQLARYLVMAGNDMAAQEEIKTHIQALRDQAASDPDRLAGHFHDLGRALNREGLWFAAEEPLREAHLLQEELSTADPDRQVDVAMALATAHVGQGELDEAGRLFVASEDITMKAHEEGSARHASLLVRIGTLLSSHGQDLMAEPFLRRTAALYAALGDKEGGPAGRGRRGEGWLVFNLIRRGETDEAKSLALDLLEYWRTQRGDSYVRAGWARFSLGLAHLEAGDPATAEPEIRAAMKVLKLTRQISSQPTYYAEVEAALAACLVQRGEHRAAEELLLQAHERADEFGKSIPRVQEKIRSRLVTLYEAWGKPAQAARWRTP